MSLRPQGKSSLQPERLTSQRTAFSPALVRYANLAPQTASTWATASGTATITTGIAAPDSTTDAATLSTVAPPANWRRIYDSERTLAIGDRVIAGVWVKASALSQGASQPAGIMDGYAAATLRIEDDTAGYTFDIDGLNYRNLTATDAADSRWEWISTNITIKSAPSGNTANLVLDLNCDAEHEVSFYAPVLWHVPADELTDDDVDDLMLGLYSVPDGAEAGVVATLRGQAFQSKIRDAGGQVFNVRAAGAMGDGETDNSAAIAEAITNANTLDAPLYFPPGTFRFDTALLQNLNSYIVRGAGPGRTVLKSTDSTKATLEIDAAAAASHTLVVEDLTIEGAATGSNNHGIYVHGSSGLFNLTLRNVHVRDCGGKGVYITNDCFTQLLEGVDVSDCGDHAIDVVSGNTTTLSRCYVHNVATNKAAYRLRYGDYTLIGCNGIDSGTTADWGVFGQNTGDDGVETYTRATLIGCNLEDFTNRGIRFKTGSFANFFSTAILAPASGTVKALEYEFVGTSATGIFDAASSINTKGASWSSGYAVHSSGAPFLQLGHTDTTSYYDTNVGGATTLPALTANLVAGSTNYALLLSRAKITALEASALVSDLTGSTSFTGDAARILLQAGSNSRPTLASTDTNGTGIYFPSSGANLAATVSGTQRLLLGTNHTFTGNVGINTAGSSSYAFEVASGAARFTGVLGASDPVLELRSATNPHLLVSDTANTITARLGTLAGAPDRAFVGTVTNHPLGFYQNNSERWTINTSGHFVPGSATTYSLGSASLPLNDVVIGGSGVFVERTTPSTPSANSLVLYAKDKGGISALYYKDDAGTEFDLSAASGASTALSNLASVAINTTLVSDTNNTDDLGTSAINWKDLYLAGTFFLAPRSDPGSPTNSDFWRSSTRNAISARISGQTEDLSTTMWRSSAQSSFDTTSAATSVIADTGVGTKTIAADRLVAGTQIRITAGGLFGTKASSAGTLTMRVRTGGTTMVTAVFTLPDGLVDQAWSLEAVGALNTTGSSGVIYWRLVWLITDSSGVVYMPNVTTNSTTINTTTSRALDVTAQFSASDADNYVQTDNAAIEVLA